MFCFMRESYLYGQWDSLVLSGQAQHDPDRLNKPGPHQHREPRVGMDSEDHYIHHYGVFL